MPLAPSYPSLTMQMLGGLLTLCHSRQLPCTSAQTPSLSMNRVCMCNANNSCCLSVLRQPVLLSYQVKFENLSRLLPFPHAAKDQAKQPLNNGLSAVL